LTNRKGGELWQFIRLLRPHYRRMGIGTLLGWVAVLTSVGLLGLSGWFISATAFAGLTVATAAMFNFYFPSGGVRIFAIARTLARYAERLVGHDATFRMLATLRVWFYRRIEPLTPARLMTYRQADILSRIVSDIESLDNLYVRVLSPSIIAALTIAAVVVFLSIFDRWIGLTALAFLSIAAVAIPLVAVRAGRQPGQQLSRRLSLLKVLIVEGVQGLAELKVFGAWDRHMKTLELESREMIRIQGHMSRIRGLSTAAITLLTGFAVLACIYIGIDRVSAGSLGGANLALVGLAALASFEAILPLPWAYQFLGQTRQAAKRLLELVQTEPTIAFPGKPQPDIHRFDIQFDQVHFRYRPTDPWILEAFDLSIEQGKRIAILGPTGIGKSTLVNLLVRFWDPQKGCIRIGGSDLKNADEPQLRQWIGVLSQQSHLFNATIQENLRLARPDADEEDIRAVLEKARILDFVSALPQNVDAWIGEGGKNLSGGQSRRLCLARLLLQDAPIWILDEPTEGLDRITEQGVMQALFEASAGRTMLLITHRAADLALFDEVVLMDRGGIIARGPHEELLRSSSRYADMLRLGEK
jgi:ATP-binding cassette subfamily C protein CydC